MLNESQRPPRRIGRSAGALLAGLLAVVILSIGTDMAFRVAGVFPPPGQSMTDTLFVLATVYRSIYSIAGSYIAARLAPDRPMAHALALGVVGLAVCVSGAAATWNRGAEFGPRWYPLALIALALPCAWVGGKIFGAKSPARPAR
jgi:hypothetical protein